MTARFLALGDSYTIGEGVPADERWPVQLTAVLRAEGFEIAAPEIVAQTGWTTDELSAGIEKAAPSGRFDLGSLLIGVNNQYRGRAVDEYRVEFDGLLRRAVAFAGNDPARVTVVSIPDWGVTPFADGRDRAGIAREIDAFNAVNRDATGNVGATYLDITAISREAARDPSLVAGDGLHPSGAMYRRWVERLMPVARSVLNAQASRGRDLSQRP